jgi:hypothetical protein
LAAVVIAAVYSLGPEVGQSCGRNERRRVADRRHDAGDEDGVLASRVNVLASSVMVHFALLKVTRIAPS